MSQPFVESGGPLGAASQNRPTGAARAEIGAVPPALQYLAALVLVALAVVLATVVDHLISAPNLTLIFVLPVVIAATSFGWWPALLAAVAGVLAFDFFFTAPYYSFRIASPSDLWAASLLLVTAAVVSTVAAEGRRRALEARRAADQAEALQALAHSIIQGRSEGETEQAAATALSRIFRVPAVVYRTRGGDLRPAARAGGATIAGAEDEAARGALESGVRVRAGTYPYDRSAFDFWPVAARDGRGFVLGLDFSRADRDRPAAPERLVEAVGGYLAAARGA